MDTCEYCQQPIENDWELWLAEDGSYHDECHANWHHEEQRKWFASFQRSSHVVQDDYDAYGNSYKNAEYMDRVIGDN